MKTTHTPLYNRAPLPRLPRHIRVLLCMLTVVVPYHAFGNPLHGDKPYEQEFLITAYYSPLPNQCCYVTGGYKADKILNGEGHTAADGTPVYAGMIAAPPSYRFGTVIELEGLGIFKVHDRGGAIQELDNGKHRLDIWIGHGEEALARALELGIEHVKGTVFPVGTDAPEVAVDFENFRAPISRLHTYFTERDNFVSLKPKVGERGLSVRVLQEHLQDIGYLDHRPTGFFGEHTQNAYENFVRDFKIHSQTDSLTEVAAANMLGARMRVGVDSPIDTFVDDDASAQTVMDAQRLLRFLGYYKGRTNGEYDETTKHAIFTFQKDHGLVGDWDSAGAGRIGPITGRAIFDAWNRNLVATHADHFLDLHEIDQQLAKKGARLERFLGEGYYGSQVRLLQNALANLGFFEKASVNGNFGPLTMEAVIQYQLDRGIIDDRDDTGAGYVGPATLYSIRKDQRNILYAIMRAEGWRAI